MPWPQTLHRSAGLRQGARHPADGAKIAANGPGAPRHGHPHQKGTDLHGEPTLLTADPALAEIVRRLIEAYAPERIYLFGSRARGDPGPDSDYDLAVIVPDGAPPGRRRSRLAYEVLRGTGVAADVLVFARSYFDARLHLRASLPATVAREGRLLHAA